MPKRKSHYFQRSSLPPELLQLANACGEVHPALVSLDRLALLDGLSARSVRDVFGYERDWALPSETVRAAIREILSARHRPSAA